MYMYKQSNMCIYIYTYALGIFIAAIDHSHYPVATAPVADLVGHTYIGNGGRVSEMNTSVHSKISNVCKTW